MELLKLDLAALLIGIVWGLIVTVALFVGGLRLKALKRSGATILKLALWTNFVFYCLFIVIFIVLYAALASDTPTAELTTAETLVGFFLLILALVEFVFQFATLVWLYRIAPMLPLSAN